MRSTQEKKAQLRRRLNQASGNLKAVLGSQGDPNVATDQRLRSSSSFTIEELPFLLHAMPHLPSETTHFVCSAMLGMELFSGDLLVKTLNEIKESPESRHYILYTCLPFLESTTFLTSLIPSHKNAIYLEKDPEDEEFRVFIFDPGCQVNFVAMLLREIKSILPVKQFFVFDDYLQKSNYGCELFALRALDFFASQKEDFLSSLSIPVSQPYQPPRNALPTMEQVIKAITSGNNDIIPVMLGFECSHKLSLNRRRNANNLMSAYRLTTFLSLGKGNIPGELGPMMADAQFKDGEIEKLPVSLSKANCTIFSSGGVRREADLKLVMKEGILEKSTLNFNYVRSMLDILHNLDRKLVSMPNEKFEKIRESVPSHYGLKVKIPLCLLAYCCALLFLVMMRRAVIAVSDFNPGPSL